jgi:hypothetical protein
MKYVGLYMFIGGVVITIVVLLLLNVFKCKQENKPCNKYEKCCSGLRCEDEICVKDYTKEYEVITDKACAYNPIKPLISEDDLKGLTDDEKIAKAASVCSNCKHSKYVGCYDVDVSTDVPGLGLCKAFTFDDSGIPRTCSLPLLDPTENVPARTIYSLSS